MLLRLFDGRYICLKNLSCFYDGVQGERDFQVDDDISMLGGMMKRGAERIQNRSLEAAGIEGNFNHVEKASLWVLVGNLTLASLVHLILPELYEW